MSRLQTVSSAILTAIIALLIVQYYSSLQPLLAIFKRSTTATYCYKHIKTQSLKKPNAKCFTVDEATGLFTDVYNNVADVPRRGRVHHSNEFVIPGLWDGHGHLLQLGEFLGSVDLFGSSSLEEALRRVEEYVEKRKPSGNDTGDQLGSSKRWIRGVGWNQAAFGRMPTADDFNSIPQLKDKFIMLDRVDVHCIWVSNAVLKLLTSNLPSHIPGGEIITDPGRGVFCDNAMDMVTKLYPRPSEDEQAESVRAAMHHLNSVGIVGIHDAGVTPTTLRLYKMLAPGRMWTIRNYAMLECEDRNTFCADDAAAFYGLNVGDRLWVRSVKLFGDGALGSWGSAMLEPYTDKPESTGSLLVNGSVLTVFTKQWSHAGYQVNIHAIGDQANRLAIDAFESVLQSCLRPLEHDNDETETDKQRMRRCQQLHHRFRIEHAQIMHPSDQQRLLSLRIIPSIQPTHATSDMYYAEARLGPQRTNERAYRMRSFLSCSPTNQPHDNPTDTSIVVLGSDFPVEPANPFSGIYAAITRKDPKRTPEQSRGWHTDQILTLQQSLDGFTTSPARAAFLEGKAGVIAPGAFADWVVLDIGRHAELGFDEGDGVDDEGRDEEERGWDGVTPDMLRQRAGDVVMRTYVGGRLVYEPLCQEPI